MRILQRMLGIVPREPESVLNSRIILRKRQQENLEKAAKLPSNEAFLDMPLSQLSQQSGPEKFGSFVSRCSHQTSKDLKFLADMNIEEALKTNPEGIPFTVKDLLKVDGLVTTCGYSKNISPSYESSEVVQLLIKEGCVPFAHTNVPQGLLNIKTGNKLWGVTTNPYNHAFTSGGSSGGEAVAVASKCSAFGLATDSAGSAKIPAAFCGVVGFKPTGSKRLSVKGRVGVTGQESSGVKDLDTSLGFMTRSVDDLSWVCERTLGKTIKYNPYVMGEWNSAKFEKMKTKKLKFGYMIEDHEMKAAPAIRNSILESVELLRKDGHQVVQFQFPELYKLRDFIFKVLVNSRFIEMINKRLEGEEEHEQSELVHFFSKYGNWGALLRELRANTPMEKSANRIFNFGGSTIDLLRAIAQKNAVCEKFLAEWGKNGLDVLITPVMPFTAPLVKSDGYLITQLTFTGFANVLEMPSGTIPVRLVRKEETEYDDLRFYGSKIANSIKRSEGLPVGIQLSSAFMDDQTCIAAMWQLERLLPKLPPPPATLERA